MSTLKTNDDCFSILSTLLTKQISSVEQAKTYLNRIKESIESNDIEALQSLIKKNDLPLKQIEEQELSRYSLIERYGYEKTNEGFIACVNAFDNADKTLQSLQKNLFKALDELKLATNVSDLLVTKNKQRVKQSLSILTGTTMTKDPTYSSQGQTKADGLTRDLAIA